MIYRVEVKIGATWSLDLETADHREAYGRARSLRGNAGHRARVKIVRAS